MCVFFKNHLEKTWSQSSKCSLLLNLPPTSVSHPFIFGTILGSEGSSAICWTSPTFEFLPKFDRGWMNSVPVSVHCSGSSWQIQRSSSTLRSAWLKIDQKISRAKPDKTYGLQDLPRPQLLTGRDHLCKRLRSSEGARFRHKMQGQGWTV